MTAPRYALIGDGRLATSFGRYLEMTGAEVCQWSRSAEATGGVTLEKVVANAEAVLLAISDGAIASFTTAHEALLTGKQLVHFSGALSFEGIAGAHPLYSFPEDPVPKARMEEIVFVTEKGGPDLETLFPTLMNRSLVLDPEQKPLYHALAVLSGNLVSFAWNEVTRVLEDDLDLEAASLLLPYFQSLIDGYAAAPRDSLTGPVKRGDRTTIDKNLAALSTHPSLKPLYDALIAAHAEKEKRDGS